MPVPNTKVFLSTTLAGGGAVKFTPNTAGDFVPFDLTSSIAPWIAAGWDINGDGRADLIIGAPADDDKDIDAGRVFVEFGTLAGGSTVNVGGSLTHMVIDGVNAGDLAGSAVGGIADLNGDGMGEILIGAPGMDNGAAVDAGVAFVVWGSSTAGADLNDVYNADSKGFAIKGQAAGDAAGTTILSVADLNGDGKMDVVVGAPGNDAGGTDAGAVYVVWGKSTLASVDLAAVAGGTGGYRITGSGSNDAVGSVVGTTTDMNGDGKAEILIGNRDFGSGGTNNGGVYVVFGKGTGSEIDLADVESGVGGFMIVGAVDDDAGAAVSGIGDVNGDGRGDILIGAPRSDHAYVVFGKADSTEVDLVDVANGIGGFRINAQVAGDLDRISVAGGSDLNRDGIADIVIGAANNEEGGSNAGAVYVIWGSGTGTVDLNLIAQSMGGAKIVGTAGSETGLSVAIVPDVSGDGAADLMIGAPGTGEGVWTLFAPASWQPDTNVYGTNAADVIAAGYGSGHKVGEGADNIIALAGNDTIDAGGGADMLDGGTGADAMTGGAGDDTYYVDNAGDSTIEVAGGGTDTVISTITHSLATEVENLTLAAGNINGTGNGLANTITGSTGNNAIDGGAGADVMIGRQGNDSYTVDNLGDVVTEIGGQGTDTVTVLLDGYTLADQVENLILAGAAHVATGNGLNNSITGTAGTDLIDGGAGNDTMTGLGGSDGYTVDSLGDVVVEAAGGGTDQVTARVSGYTLAANVEGLTLASGVANGTGNALDNFITGNTGNNVIDGGAGNDIMTGGMGNDTYMVDSLGDTVMEDPFGADGGGVDTVVASVDYVLTAGSHVENLTLAGAARHGTGNSGNNALTGSAGDDTLDGGAGIDTLAGGAGNDTYVVDSLTDSITELAGGGTDTIRSSVNFTLAEGSEIENLTLTGAATQGTGNSGNNALTGGANADTLDGGDGNDVIDGGAGADTMIGGAGDDTYYIDHPGDVIVEGAGGGTDTVIVNSDWTLSGEIENVRLVGTGHTLTGNGAANIMEGDTGNDILDGAGGDDTLLGGDGDDDLHSSSGHDILAGGAGDDTYHINGGSAHIEDFQGHDTIDCSDGVGDNYIDLSGETDSEIENEICDFGNGGTVTGALNVQFLQDLTGSFADDIANVRLLIPQIVTALNTVSGGAAFGVSSFRDKVHSPFGGAGDYIYQTDAAMGTSPTALVNAYNGFVASGGADTPESQLEALQQLALRASGEVGYQNNSARIAVLFTDAPFHTAADGLAAGLINPNDGDLIVGELLENYPEIAQLRSTLEAANIIPVFAVTAGNEASYNGLVTALGRGTVVTLGADSANIVSAITTGLTLATTTHIDDVNCGSGGDDVIGNVGDNEVWGNGGDDSIEGRGGDDRLHGGDGADTARYSGTLADYTFTANADGTITVTDTRGLAGNGTDILDAIETLDIGGTTYAVSSLFAGAPIAGNDTATGVVEATPANPGNPAASGNVLTNDTTTTASITVTAAAAGAGTLGAVSGATLITGTYGDLTINPDGSYSYALDNARPATEALATGTNVSDLFTYQVTDAGGLTATATLTVAIAGATDAPPTVVNTSADSLLVTTGIASDLDAAVLLGNDSVNNGESLTITAVSGATGGTVALVGGRLVITTTGAGGFDYTATSSSGASATGHASFAAVTTGIGKDNVTPAATHVAADIAGQDNNDTLNGTAGADRLVGGAGKDRLDGRAGADLMDGGIGNDTYLVDNAGDVVAEALNGGTDLVLAAIDHTLADNVENLTLTGATAILGTGNALANTITGNFADNVLMGLAGNDRLDGGAGSDDMAGGAGNDTYVVDDAFDLVTELAGEGKDSVLASVDFTLGAQVENLTLTGTGDIDGTGNALANVLIGNGGANVLNGGAGKNTLTGGAGADSFVFDMLEAAKNKDTIRDFVHGTDKLALSTSAFGALAAYGTGPLDPAELFYGTTAGAADQHLLYDTLTGTLLYDADGLGGAAAAALVTLTGAPLIDAGDILLI